MPRILVNWPSGPIGTCAVVTRAESGFRSDKVLAQPETRAVLHWENARETFRVVGVIATVTLLNACSSDFLVATWACKLSGSTEQADSGSNAGDMGFQFPWSTGFENGFCDYSEGNGSCYVTGAASYRIVEAPVRSGHYAAAFTVVGDGTNEGPSTNSRCHRNGQLPSQAFYGAWYYIPTLATNSGNWNLIHFQGGDGPAPRLASLWDISLVNNANGGLRLTVVDYVENSTISDLTDPPPIPIGSWFRIVVFLKRASDATGVISVFQDGDRIFHVPNLITDNTQYGEWYVGNLATDLDPVQSTLYVDDVTVGPEL